MFWRLEGQFVVVGGWLVQPRVPPKIAKIRLRIIRVCRINSVLIRMGRLKSPYDPSLRERERFYRHSAPRSSPECQFSGKCQWLRYKNKYVAFR